jgi:hypothetical protein
MHCPPRAAAGTGAAQAAPDDEEMRPLCQNCRHFQNDPRLLEASIPGLISFGSGNASVRADDGICLHHSRYVAADSGCSRFQLPTHDRRDPISIANIHGKNIGCSSNGRRSIVATFRRLLPSRLGRSSS